MDITSGRSHLKRATEEALRACSGYEAAASITRVAKSTLARYQDPNDLSYFAPVDIVLDLELFASQQPITRMLAQLQGYELVRLPDVSGDKELTEHLHIVFKESGEVIIKGAEALSDGFVSETEARSLLNETTDAIGALVQLQSILIERLTREEKREVG